jgi:tetratricopeptide (TPR) repeat protein
MTSDQHARGGCARDRGARPSRIGALLAAAALAACETAQPAPISSRGLEASIAELEARRDADPRDAGVLLALAEQYRRLGRLDDAEAAFQAAADRSSRDVPVRAEALAGLGAAALGRDDVAGARSRFFEALEVSESAGNAELAAAQRVRLGTLERGQGDLVAACDWFARAGGRAGAGVLRAEVDCADGREILALRGALQRARTAATMEGLGRAAAEAEMLAAEAEAAYAAGSVRAEDLAAAFGDYSSVLLLTSTPEAAEAAARRALEIDPSQPMLKVHLILPLILLERLEEADAATDAVIAAWTSPDDLNRGPAWVFYNAYREFASAGRGDEHMAAAYERLRVHGDGMARRRPQGPRR